MLTKRYKLKGLNLRDSDINRSGEYSSDLQNVEFDDRRQIVKRLGFDRVSSSSSLDLLEYKKGNSLIQFTANGIDGTRFGNPDLSYVWTTAPDSDEYNGVLYITDPDLNKDLFKYDGDYLFRAGMPSAEKPTGVTSGSNYYRYYYSTIDAQGNIINGDYYQFDSNSTSTSYNVRTYSDEEYKTRWANADIVANNPLGVKDNTDGLVVATYIPGHNILPNTWMMIKVQRVLQKSPFTIDNTSSRILVTEVNGNDITLDFSTLQDGEEVNFTTGGAGSLYSLVANVFYSTDETFGYYKTRENPIYQDSPTQSIFFDNVSTGASSSQIEMEDVYDTTVVKGPIPRCKYITFYNNVMVLANTSEEVDRNNVQEEAFFWSDTGVGSTVETFPPFNVDSVGISSEGDITGIKALSDNIIVGKERQIYYVNGNLILRSYRIRSALTNGIGVESFRSMQEISNGSIFMSSRGIYLAAQGGKPTEFSDIIEPIFRRQVGFDLTKSKVVNDIKNEKILIFIPASNESDSVVLVYDYLYKEWFLHRGIDADGGMVFIGEDLYHADGSDLFKRSDKYCDNGSAIDAYYKSGWDDKDYPSMTKKWKKLILLSIGDIDWTANIKTQYDWEDVDDTDEKIDITESIRVQTQSLNMAQRKSMRFEIGNNVKNEGMLITGYEYEFEFTQERPKGE